MEFKDQYKHPLWQKRRLEVLKKAEFCCQRCGDDESQLHVHHRQYFKGRKLWEYREDQLEALCDLCHQETHEKLDLLKNLLATLPADGLDEVAALIAGFRSAVKGPAMRDGEAGEFAEYFRLSPLSFKAGEIAAAAVDLNIGVQDELKFEIERNQNGGRIDVCIPDRKSFGQGFN